MTRLHHAAVMCTDLDRSLRFYRESLGTGEPYLWEAPPLVRRAAFLPCEAGTWIELFADGVAHDGPPRAPDAAGHAHVAIAVDDVHAAFARLTAAGATVLQEPVTRTLHGDPPKQATMAFLAGPDGEVLELYRNDDL